MIVYPRFHQGEVRYEDSQGESLSPRPGRHRFILSLRECYVFTLDLPPLDKKNLAPLIEKSLPDLLPMNSEELEWDIRRRGDVTWLFLIRRDLLQKIREDWGLRVILHSAALSLPEQPDDGVYRFTHPGGEDLFYIKKSVLDHTFFLDAQDEMDGNDSPVEIEHLADYGTASLFSEKKTISPFILLPILPIVLVLLLLGIGFNENRKLEKTLTALENRVQKNMASPSSEDAYPWEEAHHILKDALPRDYYGLLDTLYPLFRGRARIQSLTLEGEFVHLEATGEDGLLILEDLSERAILDDLTLHQIRQNGDGEYFIISGRLP